MTSRKRKSLSSILKTQVSPSRMALIDLNPNLNGPTDDTTHFDLEQRKKRRSSRRVSFADTYQVKEFVKDSERKEPALWDDCADGRTDQELIQQSENSSGERQGRTDGPSSASGSSHQITGLETLLSGPITQEAKTMTSAMQSTVGSSDQVDFNLQMSRNTTEMPGKASVEKEIKSNFLKSFIAADSTRTEGSEQLQGRSWMDSAPPKPGGMTGEIQPPCQDESSFKSNFLQVFMASSSASEDPPENRHGEVTRLFEKEEAGMEFTACISSANPSTGRAAAEEMGEITRIFSGQTSGINDNGMEMTTCVGGCNTGQLQRALKQPAAESTRIFTHDDNMDLTVCKTSLGNTESRFLQKTMNTTTFGGSMDFTAMFGKFSESAVARLPNESTGRLLAQVDELIGVAKTSDSEKELEVASIDSGQDNSQFKKDITRISTVLDTIQEVSSSNGSVFNTTLAGRSASLVQTDLGACPEEDAMDITSSNNALLNVQPNPSRAGEASMQMTCAVGEVPPARSQGNSSMSQATELRENQTRVFSTDEGADMEMTCAGKGFISAQGSDVLSAQGFKQETGDDNTTRFHFSGATNRELTSCLGDLPEGLAYQMKRKMDAKVSHDQKDGNGEKTCFFEAAQMEMTECIGMVVNKHPENELPNSKVSCHPEMNSSRFSFGEETRLFRSEAAADMDLTECRTKPHTFDKASVMHPSKPSPQNDHTKIYQANENCDMELTHTHSKMSSNHPSNTVMMNAQSNQDNMGSSQWNTGMVDGDKTTMFQTNEGAADMEMTACISTLPAEQPRPGHLEKEEKRKTPEEDKTQVFQTGEAANMEMTACVGTLPSAQTAIQSTGKQGQQQGVGKMPGEEDKVPAFQTGDSGDMEMTACVGTLPSVQPTLQERDRDGDMEMTACVGGFPAVLAAQHQVEHSPPQQVDREMQNEDKTRVFQSDGGADMEMTTCVGALPAVPPGSHRGDPTSREDRTCMFQNGASADMEMTMCGRTLPVAHTNRDITEPPIGDNLTKHFRSDHEGAEMDFTSCVQRGQAVPLRDDVFVERPETTTAQLLPTCRVKMDADESASCNTSRIIDFKVQENPETHPVHQSTTEITNQPCMLDTSAKLNVSEEIHEKTSDTYTLSSPTIGPKRDGVDTEDNAMPSEGRKSDTFTITSDTVCEERISPSAEELSHKHDESAVNTTPSQGTVHGDMVDLGACRGSSSSDGTARSEEAQDSHATFDLKDSIVLPDWICAEDEKGILDELPVNNDNTEDLCITAAKRPRLDESAFTISQASASMLTVDLSQLPSLPSDRQVSLSDFLQMFCEVNDLPVGKPSIMFPQQTTAPQTIGEQLEDACIVRPKADIFKWAIDFLTPTIDSLRDTVKKQEEQYSEENPALITELQNAGPEKSALILKKVKALHKYCTTSTKSKMKQWRLKMITNTKAAMEDSLKHLESRLPRITESIGNLETQLELLNSVGGSLDDAIASLEGSQLPTEEEKEEWVENSKTLEAVTAELGERKEMVLQAERERGALEESKTRLQEETTQLEGEREELRRWEAELGSGDSDLRLEEIQSEVTLAQSIQEWRLQAFSETCYRFLFLQKSIIMEVQYENDMSTGKIMDIKLESRLAADASVSAQLAHSMFFSSVSVDKLRSLFPTRASLPQMMQHLSEMVGQCRLLEAEVRRMDFWHPVTLDNNRLSIKYSSVEAHSMFHIHLDLRPGQYPFAPIPHSCTVRMGKVSEECINLALDGVEPGWRYVTRLGDAVSRLLNNQSS